jgi:hypothetical protein
MKRVLSCAASLVAIQLFSAYSLGAYTFQVLTPYVTPNTNQSTTGGVRPDGAVVGGTYNSLANIYSGAGLGTRTLLHPSQLGSAWSIAGGATSRVTGVSGGLQAGDGNDVNGNSRGFVWAGTAASVTQLTAPTGRSAATVAVTAISGTTVVGLAYDSTNYNNSHAVIWTGTATSSKYTQTSTVDVHPTGFTNSSINSFDGSNRAGSANSGGAETAIVWTGNTAASAVQLGGSGLTRRQTSSSATWTLNSFALTGLKGTRAVGYAYNFAGQFLLDSQTAVIYTSITAGAVPVSLHPTSIVPGTSRLTYKSSFATAVSSQYVVGSAQLSDPKGTFNHAALWTDNTPASFVDLHSLIPSSVITTYGTVNNSLASAIDDVGNIYGTITNGTGQQFAVVWYIPEPSALGTLLPAMTFMGRRRRK